MAEGGVDFGDDERQPLLAHTDEQDDGDAAAGGNETTGFEPGASSTPAPNGNQRQTTMNRPGEQPSFVELPDIPGGFASTTFTADSILGKEFPFAVKDNLKYKLDDKGRLQVGLLNPRKPYYRLITKIPGKEEYQINKSLPKELLKVLGKSRPETLEEKIKMLSDGINDNREVAEDSSDSQTERNKARERQKN